MALILAVTTILAALQGDFFEAGNRAYQEGDYEAAIENYSRILESGLQSPELYYNLGNSYFKNGELGKAILNYERAADLDAGNEDLIANLELARSLTRDNITALPDFWVRSAIRSWIGLLPKTALRLVTGAVWLLFGTLMTLALVTRNRSNLIVRATGWSGVATLLAALTLLARESNWLGYDEAIIMDNQVDVQSAPSPDPSLKLFELNEGSKVRLDQVAEGWVEVRLADGNVGWVRKENLEPI